MNNKHELIYEGKGKLNCLISARIFEILMKKNIPTHFIEIENENTMVAKKIKVIPLEIVELVLINLFFKVMRFQGFIS